MTLTKDANDYVVRFLSRHKAFWQWDGHKHVAELTSGKRSDVFADCTPFYSSPNAQAVVAEFMLRQMDTQWRAARNLWFIGSAMGAVGLAQALASCAYGYMRSFEDAPTKMNDGERIVEVPAIQFYPPRAAYTEPVMVTKGGNSKKTMQLKRFDLGSDPYVVVVEDVISTGGTTDLTIEGILEAHQDVSLSFYPNVVCIVDRTSEDVRKKFLNEVDPGIQGPCARSGPRNDIECLVRLHPRVWALRGDCPPEMLECVPIRPRGAPGNWDKLTTERQ